MKNIALSIVAAALLCGCMTSVSSIKDVSWSERESVAAYTEPLAFKAAAEPYGFRVPLLSPPEGTGQTPMARASQYKKTIAMASTCVSLGNGLMIDAHGFVFLDVLALLRFDQTADFRLVCASPRNDGGTVTLLRKDGTLTVSSPFVGHGEIVQRSTGTAVVSSQGATLLSVTEDLETLKCSNSTLFSSSYEAVSSENAIELNEGWLMGRSFLTTFTDERFTYNAARFPDIPIYVITKTGDTYVIERSFGDVHDTFRLYYTGRTIYFVNRGTVMAAIELGDSVIRLDGRDLATLTAAP
jgi:hypothetical protein